MYGGGVEPGENLITALRRELKEELEINLDAFTVTMLNTYHKTVAQDGVTHDVHVYIVKSVDPATLVMNKTDDRESASGCVVDTANNILKYPNITRITKLAVREYCKSDR